MRLRFLLPALPLLALPACDRIPGMGDSTGPQITISRVQRGGLPLVMTTDPAAAGDITPAECPGGGIGQQRANANYALPAGTSRAEFLVSFSDPSGIASAEFSVDARTVRFFEPTLDVESLPRHGGGTFRGYRWQYEDADGAAPFTSPVLRSMDIAPQPGLTGAPFALTATDGAGNSTTRVFFIGLNGTFCG